MADGDVVAAIKAPVTGRLFAWLVILVCGVLLVLRYWLGDFKPSEVASAVIEALLGTFVAALGVGAFLRYFAPRQTTGEISLVEPRDLNREFDLLLQSATSWRYKGNFGRWFRTKALSTLSKRAESEHRDIEVSCIVIDPRNVDLCELHAAARNSVRTADGKQNWTSDDARLEVYATIVCCFAYRSRLPIRLGFVNYFEPQRYDISASAAIITREDRKAPALRLNEGGYFLSAAIRDFSVAYGQSTRVEITNNSLRLSSLDESEVKRLLESVALGGDFLDRNISAICRKASLGSNPYD